MCLYSLKKVVCQSRQSCKASHTEMESQIVTHATGHTHLCHQPIRINGKATHWPLIATFKSNNLVTTYFSLESLHFHYHPKFDVCADVYIFYDQFVVVEPTTVIRPLVDLPVTLSYPCSAFIKQFRSNSSTRSSGYLLSIYSWKYEY